MPATSGAASKIASSISRRSASTRSGPWPLPPQCSSQPHDAVLDVRPPARSTPITARCGRSSATALCTRVSRSSGWRSCSSRKPGSHRAVACEELEDPATVAGFGDDREHPREAAAVQIEHELHELARGGCGCGVRRTFERRDQLLDALQRLLLARVRVHALTNARPCRRRTSASAWSRASCRRPGTCGRRRAGRVEAADRAHDVDALELVRPVLLEDRRALDRVLVRPGRAVDVPRAGVPGRRRVGVIVGDLAVADHEVVREHAADRLVEAAADRLVRHLELGQGPGAAGLELGQRLLDEVQRGGRGVGLEVGAGAVALEGVAPLRDLPLELHLRLERGLGQVDLDALAGRLDIADVDEPRQSGRPEAGDRPAAGVERQMIAGPLVEPARAHHPRILAAEVALLRPRDRGLVPGVLLVDRDCRADRS